MIFCADCERMTYRERLTAIAGKASKAHLPLSRRCERRWALRKTGMYAGVLISDRMQGTVGCIVRDMSATGARLEVRSDRSSIVVTPQSVPEQFVLLIEQEAIEVACAVAWRNAVDVGVRFVSPMKHLPKRSKLTTAARPNGKR